MKSVEIQNAQIQEIADTLRAHKQQKEEIQSAHEREMQNLKAAYAAETAESRDRFESSVQNDRLNHYEHLRDLKSKINREERDLETRGRQSIADKNLRLQKEETFADQEGRKRVDSTLKKYAALEEYQRRSMKQATDDARELQVKSTRQIVSDVENSIENLRAEKMNYLDERKQVHSDSLNEINDHYQNLREGYEERHQAELGELEKKGFLALNQKRLEQASLLSLQETQRSDPFYQLQRFESSMKDEGSSYRLTLKVPPHERKNLRLQASDQELEIIGVRTSDQEAFEKGRTITTRSHQTLSEKINLDVPVDSRAITRNETEMGVEFIIPKLGPGHREAQSNQVLSDAQRNQERIAKQIRFAESLPTPAFKGPESGKGTVG